MHRFLIGLFGAVLISSLANAGDYYNAHAYRSFLELKLQIEQIIDRNSSRLEKGEAKSIKDKMESLSGDLHNRMASLARKEHELLGRGLSVSSLITENNVFLWKVFNAKIELEKIRAQVER